jgi:hypothetical protein
MSGDHPHLKVSYPTETVAHEMGGKSKVRVMYRWHRYVGLLMLVFACIGVEGHAADQPSLQRVEGVGAIIQQNQVDARQKALRESWRKALEQTVADLVDIDRLVANLPVLQKQVYAQAPQYIRSYRILWEYPDVQQQVYRVGIEAEVAVAELAQKIETLGLSRSGAPRLLLLVGEQRQQRADIGLAVETQRMMTEALQSRLQAYRFHIVGDNAGSAWDGRDMSALELGRAAAADVVLIGRAEVQHTHSGVAGMPIQTVQATAQIGMWVTATGEQLAFDRARVTVDHRDAVLAGKEALGKVTAELTTRLAPILQTYQQVHSKREGYGSRGF